MASFEPKSLASSLRNIHIAQQELQQENLYRKILRMILVGTALPIKEISKKLGQKEISTQLNRGVRKLVNDNLLARTIPDVLNHPHQKQVITEKGQLFLKILDT